MILRHKTLRASILKAPWSPQPNAAQGTVVAGASTIANDGVASCSITVTVKDSTGAAIAGQVVVVSVTGTGNTVTQPSVTNSQGVAVGSFVSTHAESKTLSATANGIAITATASCTVTGSSGGTVATFTAVNRDSLAAAGGETLVATVSGITGTPSNPTVNGVTASGLVIVDSTHISFVTPALSAGGPYDIVLGGQTLSACVTVYAAITTTFRTANFDDGTSGNWTLTDNWISGTGGSHAFSTDFLLPGSTKSLKIIVASGGGDSQLHYAFADNRPLLETNGVFLHFWVYMPDATATALTASGSYQQKLHLCRKDINTNPPSWGMVGVGSAFSGKKLTLVRDAGTTTAYSTAFNMGDTQGWVEVQLGMNRKSNTGTLTLWINGLKVFSETSTSYGSDTTTDIFYPRVGSAFCVEGTQINTYFENVTLANGYIGSNV